MSMRGVQFYRKLRNRSIAPLACTENIRVYFYFFTVEDKLRFTMNRVCLSFFDRIFVFFSFLFMSYFSLNGLELIAKITKLAK